ncbi:hypothetical protein [Nevskia ramosa]|uniref:hypothetical protein n=1 Tax=Nevskia ramosa TaxID=64002 RepID=UPI003D0D399A
MNKKRTVLIAVLAVAALVVGLVATMETREARLNRLQTQYSALAEELGHLCPIAAPEDQAAFDRCRQALFGDSLLRRDLPDELLWGRARGKPLKDTPLTQFAPDVYAGLYAPLFMFAGTAVVEFDEAEQSYKATLPVAFRNRLPPGQFPYPFWHDKTKWSSYQSAAALVFWLKPATGKIRVAQFIPGTVSEALLAEATSEAAAFDGKWLWTDADGRTQPQVTVFDGLYSHDNPHLATIETAYQALALEMRNGECDKCHVPNNPNKMQHLVLLQTPAHAAGEIKRILRAVRKGEMPEDKDGHEKPLPAAAKASLLSKAEAFDAVLTEARAWETQKHSTQP